MPSGVYFRTEEHKKKQGFKKGNTEGFRKDHIPWNKNLKLKPLSEKHRKKISVASKGQPKPWLVGKKHTEKHNKKISLSNKGCTPWNKGMSWSWNIGTHIQTNTGRTHFKKGHKRGMFGKHHSEESIKKMLKSLDLRPTSFERFVIEIIQKHNLPYKYVGNGSFLIGYKNPDFVNINGEKVCVEVYCNYFKKNNYENYEKERSELFTKSGWKTIFINENELKENIVLQKLGGVQ